MTYTRAWSNTNPTGAEAASTLDDEIRNVRLDDYERMNTFLGGTAWANDPVVTFPQSYTIAKSWCSGTRTYEDTTLFMFQHDDTEGANTGLFVSPHDHGLFIGWNIGFTIPVGCTITTIKSTIYSIGTNTQLNTTCSRSNLNSNAGSTSMGSATRSPGTGWEQITLFTGTYVVVAGDDFNVGCTMNSGQFFSASKARFYGATITYTRPTLTPVY